MTEQQMGAEGGGSQAPVVVERRGHVLMIGINRLRSFVERRPAQFQGR